MAYIVYLLSRGSTGLDISAQEITQLCVLYLGFSLNKVLAAHFWESLAVHIKDELACRDFEKITNNSFLFCFVMAPISGLTASVS